jgi:hypothetical protein
VTMSVASCWCRGREATWALQTHHQVLSISIMPIVTEAMNVLLTRFLRKCNATGPLGCEPSSHHTVPTVSTYSAGAQLARDLVTAIPVF